ncbi:uncharacterized protein MELLADRAFT_112802 [Melampsora larici-populina 98AG31]|uniref:Uncharacterized protein n=1 Tax=Melampsora larici-populina (strain 98AG31 / pathotype 3-4-7) TaxID=747676 RepID=F4S7N8_MELLP|nr:uncharacterized protein MELLADRAFT_112802 [Melampsora larici-populina 98AG31]EGF99353.1 hypothetical protein MELLADRAFT_112802 [Melampsora larici-populina 98AG31]
MAAVEAKRAFKQAHSPLLPDVPPAITSSQRSQMARKAFDQSQLSQLPLASQGDGVESVQASQAEPEPKEPTRDPLTLRLRVKRPLPKSSPIKSPPVSPPKPKKVLKHESSVKVKPKGKGKAKGKKVKVYFFLLLFQTVIQGLFYAGDHDRGAYNTSIPPESLRPSMNNAIIIPSTIQDYF